VLKHLQTSEDWNEKSIGAKGFTLIELLVVIVILGVLAAVVVFSVRGVTNNSKASACKEETRTIATGVEAYYANNGSYPTGDPVAALKTAGLLNKTVTPDATVTYSIDAEGTVTRTPGC
jgi:general secretion pathway protein G